MSTVFGGACIVLAYLFIGIIPAIPMLENRPRTRTIEGQTVLAVGAGMVWPALLVGGIVWCIYKTPRAVVFSTRYLARGVRDLRKRPEKLELPEARTVIR